MTAQSVELLNVHYHHGQNLIPMGRLAIKDRNIYFEYANSFLQLGLELSPLKLPLKSGLLMCEDRVFDGLFGVFSDSLPDGWGRLLLDRKLMHVGINAHALTPLDRLAYVGSRGMGALSYKPEFSDNTALNYPINLDLIAEECQKIQEDDAEEFIDELLLLNGFSAGARPKILVSIMPNNSNLQSTTNISDFDHEHWIIKFRSSHDLKDIGAIEYAYHLMASAAGLNVPIAKLFKSKKCSGYFGVQRFDRQHNKFFHMHTLSGLLHTDYSIPSLDYETLMKATLWLTKDIRECEKQFRCAVFNVFAHNRDDHAKNFSFLMDEYGTWRVSPAYDLTFSAGPAGQHFTMIMGEGKNPGVSHLLKLAATLSIKQQTALEIIEQVRAAISKWDHFSKKAGVSRQSSKQIQLALNKI